MNPPTHSREAITGEPGCCHRLREEQALPKLNLWRDCNADDTGEDIATWHLKLYANSSLSTSLSTYTVYVEIVFMPVFAGLWRGSHAKTYR